MRIRALALSVHFLDDVRESFHRDVAFNLEGRRQEAILDRELVEEPKVLDGFEGGQLSVSFLHHALDEIDHIVGFQKIL